MSFQLLDNQIILQPGNISEMSEFPYFTDEIIEVPRDKVACPLLRSNFSFHLLLLIEAFQTNCEVEEIRWKDLDKNTPKASQL